jgi:hypothetical protein
VLGVGGATAIAGKQKLVTAAQCARNDVGDLSRGIEQARILRRPLKGVARELQMRCNRVFRTLAQASPWVLRPSFVMIGWKLCKLTVIPERAKRELRCPIGHLRISRFPDVQLHI